MTAVYLRALPWAAPIAMMLLVLGVTVEWRRRAHLGLAFAVQVLWWVASAGVAGVLLSPASGFSLGDLPATFAHGSSFSWHLNRPGVGDVTTFTETSLNVWLTVPLGSLGALAMVTGGRWKAVASPLVPVLGEAWQGVASWGRAPAQLQDVMLNEVGLIVGVVLAGALLAGAALARKGG